MEQRCAIILFQRIRLARCYSPKHAYRINKTIIYTGDAVSGKKHTSFIYKMTYGSKRNKIWDGILFITPPSLSSRVI